MPLPLLVVAAHPDDETIGAGGLLVRARSAAAVVHLTDGAPRDPRLRPAGPADRSAYARLRRDEAVAALSVAGLAAGSVHALGAVDQEAMDAIAPLAREVAAILRRLEPRVVVTHALEGGHPDHDAAALVVRAAAGLLARAGARIPALVEMTSYHLREGRLAVGVFPPDGDPGRARPLGGAERSAKRRMLACYASQREVLEPFAPTLDAERFRRAGPVSLELRPLAPPLHYEALGWTTFERFRAAAEAALATLGATALVRPRRGEAAVAPGART